MRYFIILLYFFITTNFANQYEIKNILVNQPVLKLNVQDGKTAAGYLVIKNNTKEIISLIGIKSEISNRQEIHQVKLENNIYKMRPVEGGIIIKPDSILALKPKSFHFMFYDLKKPVISGEKLKAKLLFQKKLPENKIEIDIEFKVQIGENNHNH